MGYIVFQEALYCEFSVHLHCSMVVMFGQMLYGRAIGMHLRLKDKYVLITGATRGIGLATAKAFLEEGSIVFLNGHDRIRLEERCRELGARFPRKVIPCLGDITSEAGVEDVMRVLQKETAHLDVAVMNLGTGKPEGENLMQPEEWRRFYEINTISAVAMLDRLQPLLKRGKGANVVLISSIIAREAASAPVGYAAAKSAVLVLNRYLSGLWAKDGIRVNCVLPGNVYFPGGRWEELLAEDETGVQSYIASNVPLRRFGHPEEIADAVLFLASERAGFITGAALNVDGGQQRSV